LNTPSLTLSPLRNDEIDFVATDGELEQDLPPAFDQIEAVLEYLQEASVWPHAGCSELAPVPEHSGCCEFLPMLDGDNFGANAEVKFVYMYCEPESLPQTEMWCSGGDSQPPHEVREGDWNCLNCGDFQFGRNSECRICGAPKPKPSKDVPAGQPQLYAAVLYPIDGSGNINADCPISCVMPVIADTSSAANQALVDGGVVNAQPSQEDESDQQTNGQKKSRRRRRRRGGRGTHKDTWEHAEDTYYDEGDESWHDESWNSWDDKADSSQKWKNWNGWSDWSESFRESKWKPCSA